MQPTLPAPAGSILDLVARAWVADQPAVFPLRPTVRIGSATLIPVAIDNGNDALKGATLRHDPTLPEGEANRTELTTIRIPTAFGLAQEIQGRQEVTYTCDGVSVSLFTTNSAPTTTLGPGWRHSFATALTLPTQAGGEPNRVIYEAPTGNRLRFTAPTQTGVMDYTPAPGVRASLVAEDSNTDGTIDSYIVTTASQRVQRFDAQGRITSETDAQGRELTYTYFSNTGTYLEGLLQTVTDASSGQTLSFQYVNNGGTVRLITVANAVNATVSYDFMTQPVAWKL
jgi:hypothetical protein